MPKDNFGNKSRFNEGVGKKKPFKQISDYKVPEVKRSLPTIEKKPQEVNKTMSTQMKKGVDVNKLSETPIKIGTDVNPLSSTPKKIGTDMKGLSETPIKIGTDVNPLSSTPKKIGTDTSPLADTPLKIGKDVNVFDNSSKLNSDIEINNMLPTEEKSVPIVNGYDDTPKLENTGKDFKPFSTEKLSSLKDYSPLGNDDIREVDFFSNNNAKGFTKNFDEGIPTQYVEDSSTLDLPDKQSTYNPLNKYEDTMYSKDVQTNYLDVQSNLVPSNPVSGRPLNHLDNIGTLSTEENNVTQEVDFFQGINSYWENVNPAVVGFTSLFTDKNGSLLITGGVDSSLDNLLPYRTFDMIDNSNPNEPVAAYENYKYDPRTPRLGVPTYTDFSLPNRNFYFGSALDNLEENNLNHWTPYLSQDGESIFSGGGTAPFVADSDGDGILDKLYNDYWYDFRDHQRTVLNNLGASGPLGSSGQKLVKFYNAPNLFSGSDLDELLTPQNTPIAGGAEDYPLISQYVGQISGAPYFNPDDYSIWDNGTSMGTGLESQGDPFKKYDQQYFDPRPQDRIIFGHDPPFWHPQNIYKGTIFDDPLREGVDGGGNFNADVDGERYSDTFRIINKPNIEEIAQDGNQGFGHIAAQTAIDLYKSYFGVFEGDNNTNTQGYIGEGTSLPITGETPLGNGSVQIDKASWYYSLWTTPNATTVTNEEIMTPHNTGQHGGDSNSFNTRTISVDGSQLTGKRLGFDDLIFGTLFDTIGGYPIGNVDNRLDIEYTTLGGPRGQEPYVKTNVPDNFNDSRVDDYLFGTTGYTPDGYSPSRADRASIDKDRLAEFFRTNKGKNFLTAQKLNFRKNPRSMNMWIGEDDVQRVMESGAEGKLDTYRPVSRGAFGALAEMDVYTGTVFESLFRPFGIQVNIAGLNLSTPTGMYGDIVDAALLITNTLHAEGRLDDEGSTIPFIGGAAFQVLNWNRNGLTIKTNVAPTTLEELLDQNVSNLLQLGIGLMLGKGYLQTDAGGMSEFSNPRALSYMQKGVSPFGFKQPWFFGLGGNTDVMNSYNFSSWKRLGSRIVDGGGETFKNRENNTLDKVFYDNVQEINDVTGFEGVMHTEKKGVVLPTYNQIYENRHSSADLFFGKDIDKYETRRLKGLGDNASFAIRNMDVHTFKKLGTEDNSLTSGNSDPVVTMGAGNWLGNNNKKQDVGTMTGKVHNNSAVTLTSPLIGSLGLKDAGSLEIEGEGELPVYFKDLRDNGYIILRGYINNMVENLTGRWGEDAYIGRSEPVFSYEMGTRDITFTLRLAAQTKLEFRMIYKKLNQLTSLVYPRYKTDNTNFGQINSGGKLRAQPPLVRMRIGELFGNSLGELPGFIRSINNIYSDQSPWETQKGLRAPKFIDCTISFQVIHAQVPGLDTNFYGLNNDYIGGDGRKINSANWSGGNLTSDVNIFNGGIPPETNVDEEEQPDEANEEPNGNGNGNGEPEEGENGQGQDNGDE